MSSRVYGGRRQREGGQHGHRERREERKEARAYVRRRLNLSFRRQTPPTKLALDDRNQLVARLEFPVRVLDRDGAVALDLFGSEEVGEAVEGDVGFDEGGENDGKDLHD